MNERYEIEHYEENGRDIFENWLKSLRDIQGAVAIDRAVARMKKGNFGKAHFCRDGVWELVIDTGPGYRVYYSLISSLVILLLCGGSKRTQQGDIEKAVAYLKRYKEARSI